MKDEEFTTLTDNTLEQRNSQVREVSNGYVIVTNRIFLDAATETQKFSIGQEGVASSTADLLAALGRFYETGDMSGETKLTSSATRVR